MLLILYICLLGNFAHINTGFITDVTWYKIRGAKISVVQPRGRFDALTWVDDKNQLWLYGGKTIVRTNGSKFITYLHDLWKFSASSYQWTRITYQNSSNYPQFDKSLSCFCDGQAFVLGYQMEKRQLFSQLWQYNVSSNVWNTTRMSSYIKTSQTCFSMSCNVDLHSITLLCQGNATVVKWWTFMIKSGTWNFQNNTLMPRNTSTAITELNATRQEYLSNRRGLIQWIDSHGNLQLLGENILNVSRKNPSTAHYYWIRVTSKNFKPISRNGACFWQVSGNLWLFGGYRKVGKERMVVLHDFWFGNSSMSLVHGQPIAIEKNLPGDTLGLSMLNKFIISLVTLFVVVTVSVRLCYKRELNQLLSRLKRNKVLYHQLSQEGDKSTRL